MHISVEFTMDLTVELLSKSLIAMHFINFSPILPFVLLSAGGEGLVVWEQSKLIQMLNYLISHIWPVSIYCS